MMRTFRCFLLTVIAILIFPVLNAQDITGDWYGKLQTADSLHVNLHIYKDFDGLKATMDSPDQAAFGIPIDEITLEEDTLFFRILAINATYQGRVNQDCSIIYGNLIQLGRKNSLDFGRKKLMRIIQVNDSSLTVMPAKVRVIKTGNPKKIPYTGISVVEAGIPKVIEIDTSELKVLTPGKDAVLNPMVYKFPEPIIKGENTIKQVNTQFAPIIVRQNNPNRFRHDPCE
jgi:hypothetical protein